MLQIKEFERMKVLIYENEKLKEKYWGDLACSHLVKDKKFEVQTQGGTFLHRTKSDRKVKMVVDNPIDETLTVYEEGEEHK